jgi:hypothetical protein
MSRTDLVPRVNRLVRYVNYTPAPSAVVKNKWSSAFMARHAQYHVYIYL